MLWCAFCFPRRTSASFPGISAYPASPPFLYEPRNDGKNSTLESAMNATLDWFEKEPSLYVAIIGSTQKKAWCAGQDLKEMVHTL